MNSSEISSEAWMASAQKAWISAQGAPSASDLMTALHLQLATVLATAMSEALAKGIAELTAYAASGLDDDESALDAETEALAV
ncbi:MAG: hypothetical protein GY811_19670, partial [Myxococcales bacterium]|nr:hypothetical protein [Myxococcales bacterium]